MSDSDQIRELQKLARELAEISERMAEEVLARSVEPGSAPDELVLKRAERIYWARRQRDKFFDGELLGEPSWDILLDLFIQGQRGTRVSVHSACIAASVPTTTALRRIQALISCGMINRVNDLSDGRRTLLTLSDQTRDKMFQYLRKTL